MTQEGTVLEGVNFLLGPCSKLKVPLNKQHKSCEERTCPLVGVFGLWMVPERATQGQNWLQFAEILHGMLAS